MRSGRFRWRSFGAACAASLLLHVFYIIPRVLAPLVEKPEPQLEVVMEPDPAEAPTPEKPDQPKPILDEPAPVEAKKEKEKKLPVPTQPPPEVAKVEEPKKPEPPKPKQEPPKPIELPKQHMQMVDQQKFPDETDNSDARYLAQKNHRTDKDVRDKNSNLIREVQTKQEQVSEENQRKDQTPGAKDEKIAELENRTGPDKTMPRSAPREGVEGMSTDKQKPGPLSMRDLTPKSSVEARDAQKPREGVEEQERGAGELPMARIGRDAVRGHAAAKGGVNFNKSLDHHMYDDIEGYDTAEKERRQAARAESSHHAGRYERYLAKAQAMRSSIENFTLAVKPGNQSELGTRAYPFAGYITSMHRQIHKLFAFGFLTDLEQRLGKGKGAYDDPTLFTKLEIVINPDGTVFKVNIVKSSGVTGFDVAAIDSVMSAAPFEVPPKTIRSTDGKTYLHWGFHRDELACIAELGNVQPFILTTPGETPRDDQSTPSREPPRRLQRESEAPARGSAPAASVPAGVPEVNQEARDAAEGWFAAYQRRSVEWMAGWSATPFTAAGEVVARDGDKLKAMYKQLLAEAAGGKTLKGVEVLTPAGIRGKLGGLPPGGDDEMLYAVGKAGGEEFILLLKRSNKGWRVAGIAR